MKTFFALFAGSIENLKWKKPIVLFAINMENLKSQKYHIFSIKN